jgi:hypothetical protein
MDKSEIIGMIGVENFQPVADWAWQCAADTGKGVAKGMFSSDLPYEICELIWSERGLTNYDRLSLIYDIYEEMPCYWFLASVKMNFKKADAGSKQMIWDRYRKYLDLEQDVLAGPVRYSLWCDFFEDPDTVQEAWKELALYRDATDRTLERILPESGPVPFELKDDLFRRLLPERRWHPYIYQSLLFSAFNVYGKIEMGRARDILSQLELPADVEHLDLLRQKLGR